MRIRPIALLVLFVLPAVLGAQTRGRRPPTVSRPPGPTPLPPQAPVIANQIRYRASRFSMETYPLYSFLQTDRSAVDSGPSSWSTLGAGTRIEWRFRPTLFATADLTTSFLSGQFAQNTIDIGGRYRPVREDYLLRPYFDVRTSWSYTYASYGQNYYAPPTPGGGPLGSYDSGRSSSRGLGALVGTGFDVPVTNSIAVTTGVSLSRYAMSAVRLAGEPLGARYNYHMTAARFTIGLKYNPIRMITGPAGEKAK